MCRNGAQRAAAAAAAAREQRQRKLYLKQITDSEAFSAGLNVTLSLLPHKLRYSLATEEKESEDSKAEE